MRKFFWFFAGLFVGTLIKTEVKLDFREKPTDLNFQQFNNGLLKEYDVEKIHEDIRNHLNQLKDERND